MGKLARALGLSRISARPQHAKSAPAAQAQLRKNLPSGAPPPSATRLRADGSSSGFRCDEGGLPGDWWVSNLLHRSRAWPPRPPNMVASSILPLSCHRARQLDLAGRRAAARGREAEAAPDRGRRDGGTARPGDVAAGARPGRAWSGDRGGQLLRGRTGRLLAAPAAHGQRHRQPRAGADTGWSRPASWSSAARGGPRPTGSTPKACCAC